MLSTSQLQGVVTEWSITATGIGIDPFSALLFDAVQGLISPTHPLIQRT